MPHPCAHSIHFSSAIRGRHTMWLQRGYVLSEVVLSFWRDLGFVLGLGLLSSPVALPAAKQGADYSFCAPQLKSKSSCNLESSHERTVAQRKTSVKGSLQMRQKRSLTKNCLHPLQHAMYPKEMLSITSALPQLWKLLIGLCSRTAAFCLLCSQL